MSFHAYLLRCADGSYYTGHTDDLDLRLAQHALGLPGGYTARRRPVTLVWSSEFPTREEALATERQIKGWSRANKEALIAGDWERIRSLARNKEAREADGMPRPSTGSGRTEFGRKGDVEG